jgi:hypothetical protein
VYCAGEFVGLGELREDALIAKRLLKYDSLGAGFPLSRE